VSYIQKEFGKQVEITTTGSKDDNITVVKNADIVIYSVPISLTEKIIKETLSYIKT